MPAAKAFLSAFSKITGTGNFHAAGTAPFFLPELHLEGLREVGYDRSLTTEVGVVLHFLSYINSPPQRPKQTTPCKYP